MKKKEKQQFTLKQMWAETAKKIDSLQYLLVGTKREMTKAEIIDKAVTQFRNRKLNQIKKGKQQ